MCSMNFFKGMGAGLIIGACIGMKMTQSKKQGKKMAGRAVKFFNDMIDDLTDAMGL